MMSTHKTKRIICTVLAALILLSGLMLYAEPRAGGSWYAYGEALQKANMYGWLS